MDFLIPDLETQYIIQNLTRVEVCVSTNVLVDSKKGRPKLASMTTNLRTFGACDVARYEGTIASE